MTVLHCTKSIGGGAGIASYRLHQGLVAAGVDSRLLVEYDTTNDPTVYGPTGIVGRVESLIRNRLNSLPLFRYPNRGSTAFSPVWLPDRRGNHISEHDPDIVHLHWVAGGYIQPKTIAKLDASVVWTLHDMWPFTGGCHYSNGCDKYRQRCGACPKLASQKESDISQQTWQRKREAWSDLELTVVSPSQWLAQCARASSLFVDTSVKVIPNGLDTTQFRPRRRDTGIDKFGLEAERKYILFGSSYGTKRKGLDLLIQALDKLNIASEIAVLTFGNINTDTTEIPYPVIELGYLSESDLQLAYSTADVTAIPSRQDNLPNIAVEAQACGTPCVAFELGGIPDIIQHKKTGYLATPLNTSDFARGIKWVLEDCAQTEEISSQAATFAQERFDIKRVAEQYQQLYQTIISA